MGKLGRIFSLITSVKFWINALLILIVTVVLFYLTLKYLDHYTLHGHEIEVPELVGLHKSELKNVLEAESLRYIIIDSTFNHLEAKGTVMGQNPKAFSKVKRNRTIYISVNAENPPSVKLPMVIDKSLRQASSILKNIGLQVGELKYIPDQCVNCVLAQEVNGKVVLKDTSVQKGTKVDLVLGGGLSDEKVLVPWLHNLTKEEAKEKLKASFLNLGAELYDGSVFDDEDSSSARIFAQHPQYGELSWVYMGSTVDVEFTKLLTKIDSIQPKLDSSKFPAQNLVRDSVSIDSLP